ncbi:hypothetical protein RB201_37300 [Streptomyces sp. S1A(2023)]
MAPPDDKEAQGKAANAEKMNAAKPGEFDKKAFIDAVNKAIDSQAPKNLDEADKFAKSGKADQVKAEVDGKVTDGKESSVKDIDTATKAPPDTSAAKDKDVTPLSPDQPPGNPGAPSATDAVPEKQSAAVTDFSEGPAENDKAMADAEVTEEQLAKGNEPGVQRGAVGEEDLRGGRGEGPREGEGGGGPAALHRQTERGGLRSPGDGGTHRDPGHRRQTGGRRQERHEVEGREETRRGHGETPEGLRRHEEGRRGHPVRPGQEGGHGVHVGREVSAGRVHGRPQEPDEEVQGQAVLRPHGQGPLDQGQVRRPAEGGERPVPGVPQAHTSPACRRSSPRSPTSSAPNSARRRPA